MKECPFCREQIQEGAIKCRYCQSMLVQVISPSTGPALEGGPPSQVTYVLDRGLVEYLKSALGVIAILVGVAAYFFGLDIRKGLHDMDEQVERARKSADDSKKIAEETAKITPYVEQIKLNAKEVELATQGVKNAETKVDTRITEMLKSGSVVSEERARKIFEDLMVATAPKLQSARDSDAVRMAVRQAATDISHSPENEEAFRKIREDMTYAVNFYNAFFKLNLVVPPYKPLDPKERNAYWSANNTYYAPPQVRYLSDVTYHEMAHPFLARVGKLGYHGQSGSLVESFADVFASLTKQHRLGQGSAQDADWVIAPKGVAFILGEDLAKTTRLEPLRSMKDPGGAYNNSVLGKDPQRAHIRDLYTGESDYGGIHINMGIPNKGFYATAIRIGSNKAGQIWLQAWRRLGKESSFHDAAVKTYEVAGELYGGAEQEAVKAAWASVGLGVS